MTQHGHRQAHGRAQDASTQGEHFVQGVFQVEGAQDAREQNQGPLEVLQPFACTGCLFASAASVAFQYQISNEYCQRVAKDQIYYERDLHSLDYRVVSRHHLHYNWLVQLVSESVVAQLRKANVDRGEDSERNCQDGRKLLPIFGCTHDRHDAANSLEHEEREADGVPVVVPVDGHESLFLEVIVVHCDVLPERLVLYYLLLDCICVVDVLANAEGRYRHQSHDYHRESKNKSGFEGFNFSDPGDRRKERQNNQPEILLFQVFYRKQCLRSRFKPLNDE